MIKVIQSGDMCEVYQDDHLELPKRKHRLSVGYRAVTAEELKGISVRRAKKGVKRIVWANYQKGKTAFITLTFKYDWSTDYERASAEIKKFFKRLAYAETGSNKSHYKYICVPEVQEKSKRYHFHILVFNFPYMEVERLGQVWGNGGVNIQRVFGGCNHCANYVTKYFSKSFGDSLLKSKKRYYRSKNLQNSVVFKGESGAGYFGNFHMLGHKELYTYVSPELRFTYSIYVGCIKKDLTRPETLLYTKPDIKPKGW